MSQQINLYDVRLRPRRLVLTGQRMVMALAVVVTLSGAWAFWVRGQAESANAEAARLVAETKEWQAKHDVLARQMAEKRLPAALQSELETARTMLSVRQEVIGELDSGRLGNAEGFSGLFTGFSRQADRELWLTGFVVSLGGHEIEIHGKLFDSTRLPGYVQRLSTDPAFKGRRFAALTMASVEPVEAKPGVTTVTPQPVAAAGETLKLPRHIEFVLRSENAGEGAKSTEARK